MKLIKIGTDHYVITDDSEIKVGDYITDKYRVWQWKDDCSLLGRMKVTHSTLPLEEVVIDVTPVGDAITGYEYGMVKQLSLPEVKQLIGEVDIESRYNETWLPKYQPYDSTEGIAFKTGYKQCLEDNKEKKYTEADIISVVYRSWETGLSAEYCIMTLRSSTGWDVDFIDNKLKLK